MLFFLSEPSLSRNGIEVSNLKSFGDWTVTGASVCCLPAENTVRHHHQCFKTWRPTCRRAEVDSHLASHRNINSKWIKTFKV